jgi:hypothetical protein
MFVHVSALGWVLVQVLLISSSAVSAWPLVSRAGHDGVIGNPIQERYNFTPHEITASTFPEIVRYLYRQQSIWQIAIVNSTTDKIIADFRELILLIKSTDSLVNIFISSILPRPVDFNYFPMESVITRTLFVSRRATEIKSNIICHISSNWNFVS